MAAFIQRRRHEKQARADNSASVPQNPAEATTQSTNVLRRIKSSPLIRLVSTSAKKRERDNEFPFPVIDPPTYITSAYLSACQTDADPGVGIDHAEQVIPQPSENRKVARPDLQLRTRTEPPEVTPQDSTVKVLGSPIEINTDEVGLAITEPSQGLRDSYVNVYRAANAHDESAQGRHEQASANRDSAHTTTGRTHPAFGPSHSKTSGHNSREPRCDLRPRGPRDIRNTLELFPKPRTAETGSSGDVASLKVEDNDLRRTSSPLLPLESPSVDEIPSRLDEISHLPVVQPDHADQPAQKHRNEDAQILWSLQKDSEADIRKDGNLAFGPELDREGPRRDDNKSYSVRRSAPQEGTIEPQRSKSTSVSSSDRSSTVGRGQSSTSTTRQSLSAASTTTHGSPPPQYLFTHRSKESARDRAEKSSEQALMPQRLDGIQARPQTAPEEDRRPRGGVKQRFPVVPRVQANSTRPYPASLPPDRPDTINVLRPARSQPESSETSLPKTISPNYKLAGAPTFIRDGSFFRPLPAYPRGQAQESSSRGTQTCSCSTALSPLAGLSIEELRAQNAMLRAALEAVIGP